MKIHPRTPLGGSPTRVIASYHLQQQSCGKKPINRVIAYASCSLTPAEKNCNLHAGKIEFLALKWAVSDQFRDYLNYVPEFTVYTDNNPLTYILTSAKLNATSLRWVGELADFRFQVKYRPGKSNSDTGTLSRIPLNIEDYMATCCEGSSLEVIQAAVCSAQFQSQDNFPWLTALTDPITALDADHTIPIDQQIDLQQAQELDPVISRVVNLIKTGKRPSVRETKGESRDVKRLLFEWDKLTLGSDNVLYRKTRTNTQVLLPRQLRRIIFKELHEDTGHLGVERVFDLATARFYWPHMKDDITHFVTKVCRCIKQKPPVVKQREPLKPIVTTAPFQMVSLDFLHVEASVGGYIILPGMHKLMQPKISRQRQQQREHIMTSSCDLEFLKQSTTIKVVNLRTNCFTIWINALEHAIQEQPRTTLRGMVRLNASTGHYSQCSGLCQRGISQGGECYATKCNN